MKKTIEIEFILSAIKDVGDFYAQKFRSDPVPETSEELWALFQKIDEGCLKKIETLLHVKYPDIPFADGELDLENQKIDLKIPEYWICDSMDGAVQYMKHLPGWTFNIVLVRDRKMRLAVVYDPLHGEMYWAEKGKGAFLNGKPIHAIARKNPDLMLVGTSHPPFPAKTPGLIQKISDSTNDLLNAFSFLRNFGPTALQIAYVAAGRLDVFSQEGIDTFNWLPGVLIAQEAGAKILTKDGQNWNWGDSSIFVSAPGVENIIFNKK